MGATLAFQAEAGKHGLAVYNSVQSASQSLHRLLQWQTMRDRAPVAAK